MKDKNNTVLIVRGAVTTSQLDEIKEILEEDQGLLSDVGAGRILKTNKGEYLYVVQVLEEALPDYDRRLVTHDKSTWFDNGHSAKYKDERRIVSVEPWAKEFSALWAYQQWAMLGKTIAHKRYNITWTPSDTKPSQEDWLRDCARSNAMTGWNVVMDKSVEPKPKEPKPEPIPTKKIQNCDPLSLSITDLTQIAGRCLFNLAGKDGEPSSSCLEGIEAKFTKMLSAIAEPQQQINSLSEPGVHQVIFAEPGEPKEPEYIGYRKDENGNEIEVPDYQEQLEKFVVGKRVKMLYYGGNLAKSGDTGVITSVQPHEGWIGIHLDSNVDVLVNYTCAEPVEPAPRLNVGDWVTDGVVTGKVTSVNGNIANVKTPNAIYVLNTENLKPIPKSEVKVTLSLEGTVEKRPANDAGFKLRYGNGLTEYALIDYAQLSPAQAEMVRELVEG